MKGLLAILLLGGLVNICFAQDPGWPREKTNAGGTLIYYGATRQGSNAYSQWGSSVVTKGGQWAQTGHNTDSRGTIAGGRTSEGGRVVAGSGQNGRGFVDQGSGGDIYAGKDGNVYKKTDGGWQEYENGGWNPVDTSGAKPKAQQQSQGVGQRRQDAQGSGAASSGQMRPASQPTFQPATPRSGASSPSQGQALDRTGQSSQIQDLNREAQARQVGAQRTQSFQRERRSGGARSRRR